MFYRFSLVTSLLGTGAGPICAWNCSICWSWFILAGSILFEGRVSAVRMAIQKCKILSRNRSPNWSGIKIFYSIIHLKSNWEIAHKCHFLLIWSTSTDPRFYNKMSLTSRFFRNLHQKLLTVFNSNTNNTSYGVPFNIFLLFFFR